MVQYCTNNGKKAQQYQILSTVATSCKKKAIIVIRVGLYARVTVAKKIGKKFLEGKFLE